MWTTLGGLGCPRSLGSIVDVLVGVLTHGCALQYRLFAVA